MFIMDYKKNASWNVKDIYYGDKDCTLGHEKGKWQIKYLEKSLPVLFADQRNQLTINATYKNKMKTYCLKCKKDTENIDWPKNS